MSEYILQGDAQGERLSAHLSKDGINIVSHEYRATRVQTVPFDRYLAFLTWEQIELLLRLRATSE